MRFLLTTALLASVLLTACGVKGPPVAPIREKPVHVNIDCSVYDPECDLRDPNYVPGLDPNKPADAKKIQALEAKQKKTKQQ